MTNRKGRLIWITGLSGAGKTTIGKLLYERMKREKQNIVFLDGDTLRQIFDNNGYTPQERKASGFKVIRLCKSLTEQGIDVVCCVIGMFDELREWNRENIENYFEIYLRVKMDTLIERDQKKLYSRALQKEISNVVGIDIPYEEPKKPDMAIDNDGNKTPEEIVAEIIETINKAIGA